MTEQLTDILEEKVKTFLFIVAVRQMSENTVM